MPHILRRRRQWGFSPIRPVRNNLLARIRRPRLSVIKADDLIRKQSNQKLAQKFDSRAIPR